MDKYLNEVKKYKGGVEIGKGYSRVKMGDTLEAGDETLSSDGKWIEIHQWAVGDKVKILQPTVRRKLK